MYSEFFVLTTADYFGVFQISAETYPQEFLDNISNVKVVNENMLEHYLIKELGRNILINKNFNVFTCLGNLYSRKSN